MAKLLFLAHRMPFPPDKGDKITTYNLLRHLVSRHEVHVGAFVDDPADWQYEAELRRWCKSVHLIGLSPRWRKLGAARALLGGQSITEVYHRHVGMQAWVDRTVSEAGIEGVLAYCSAMAPYLANARHAGLRRVTHYADVDSQKWQAYAEQHAGPKAWLYAREARTVLAMERASSAAYDATGFVTDADAELYRRLAPESAHKVCVIPNGVDTTYFDALARFDTPFGQGPHSGERAIVFTGAMDYWPNVDAVAWFAKEVLPRVREAQPQARFWIVGSRPSREVQDLQSLPGVSVTGRVPDVRPYIQHAAAVVVPLRLARGVQNKVLEAYAMARPVVLARASAGGLRPAAFIEEDTCDSAEDLAAGVLRVMSGPGQSMVARDYVLKHYSWEAAFRQLDTALGLN